MLQPAPTSDRRRGLWIGLGGLLAALALAGAHLLLYAPFTADDAFISFRYARNFALGHGLVFNIGERVEGYSTFVWVVGLGLLGRAGLDIPLAAKLLNGALTLAAVLATALLRPDGPARRRWSAVGLWAALLLAGDPAFGYWGANGMEVPLVTLLLLCGGALHLRELERGGPPVSALLFGALALTRPEGAFFGALTLLHRAISVDQRPTTNDQRPTAGDEGRRTKDEGPATKDEGRRTKDEGAAANAPSLHRSTALSLYRSIALPLYRWLGVFLLIVVPFLLWRRSYYGEWVPNTVLVKSGFGLRVLLEGGLSVYQFAVPRAGALLLAGLGLLAAPGWWRRPWRSYAALLLLGNALFVTLAGGDWMPLDRFWVLVLPWLYLLAADAPAALAAQWPAALRPWRGALPAALLALALAGSLVTRLTTNVPTINNAGPTASRWLRQVARPGDVVASSNIGAVGYFNMDLVIVDMVGLTDARIAKTPARFPGGLLARGNGYGHWDSAYILARRPRFVEIAGVGREQALRWEGRGAWAGADDLYRNPEFRRLYRYGDVSYFVRADGQ